MLLAVWAISRLIWYVAWHYCLLSSHLRMALRFNEKYCLSWFAVGLYMYCSTLDENRAESWNLTWWRRAYNFPVVFAALAFSKWICACGLWASAFRCSHNSMYDRWHVSRMLPGCMMVCCFLSSHCSLVVIVVILSIIFPWTCGTIQSFAVYQLLYGIVGGTLCSLRVLYPTSQ